MHSSTGLLLASLLASSCCRAWADNALVPPMQRPLQFSQALHYALEHSPVITSAKSNLSEAEAQKLAAVAALLPTLSLTEAPEIFTPIAASGSSVVGGVVVPSGHGFNANVATANLSLNLFSGGKEGATLRASLHTLRSASLGLTATLDTLFGQLLTDFTAVGVDQITLRQEEHVVRLTSDLVRLTSLRLKGRVSSKIDVIQAQQQLLQAQLKVSQARQQWVVDLEKVYTDIGLVRAAGEIAVEESIPSAPFAFTRVVPIQDDPAVKSALETVVAAQETVTAAHADYYPTVSLVGQYNYLGVDPSSMRRAFRSTHANNYAIGIEVVLPILPLLNVQSEVDAAHARVESAVAQYRGALVTSANLITDAGEKFREAHEALGIATRAADLARRNVRLVQDSYVARQASLIDVDNANVAMAEAAESLAVAAMNFRAASWERARALDAKDFPTELMKAVLDSPRG